MTEPDWEDLQTFLCTAQAGTFTGAAKKLGVSQPTVSRRIDELETNLGAPLFLRHSRGLKLTDRGALLLDAAKGLDSQIKGVFQRSRNGTYEPAGVVRLCVNELIAIYALPPALKSLRDKFPNIHLEIVVDNSSAELNRRKADLAVRTLEPQDSSLSAKRIGEAQLGFFASQTYLASNPLTEPFEFKDHTVLGFDANTAAEWPAYLKSHDLVRDDFAVRTDSSLMQITAASQGVGIVATHVQVGQRMKLTEVQLPTPLPVAPIWLIGHEALQDDLAVRAVANEVERALRSYLNGAPCGQSPLSGPSLSEN